MCTTVPNDVHTPSPVSSYRLMTSPLTGGGPMLFSVYCSDRGKSSILPPTGSDGWGEGRLRSIFYGTGRGTLSTPERRWTVVEQRAMSCAGGGPSAVLPILPAKARQMLLMGPSPLVARCSRRNTTTPISGSGVVVCPPPCAGWFPSERHLAYRHIVLPSALGIRRSPL